MAGLSILLFLLTPPQDPKKVETPAVRARVVPPVRQIIVQPPPPGAPLPAVRFQVNPNVLIQQVQANQKTITLVYKEVPALDDPDMPGGPIPQPARAMQLEEFALSSSNFDPWVFESDLTEESRNSHLDSILTAQVLLAKANGTITPEQEQKLVLAGRGDIKRFFDRVEVARANFESVRQDFNAGRVALGQLEWLAAEYQMGPFGPESLFRKSWGKIRRGQDRKPPGQK